ncbi:MAG: TIM barrel protein [Tannerellaceae bacterium]|nr:TIM barrel protein [Tannerellaceae bacterium]
MKRRTFLKTTGLITAAVGMPGLLKAFPAVHESSLPGFGILTGNTGGKWFENNPEAALRELAGMGYTDLEFGDTYGMELSYLKSLLKELKMNALLGPTSMGAMLDEKQLMKDIRACQEIGKKYIVCYWPWVDGGQNKTADDWKQVAERLNKGGAICKKEGLQLLYHNHDMEFLPVDGQIPFDIMMEILDPSAVNIELDLYWITKGNQSAEEYIRKYPGRYPVFHVKDMDKTPERGFECIGEGCIDFPSIFRLNQTAGVRHFIVEHDEPADPEACVRTAAAYLSRLTF